MRFTLLLAFVSLIILSSCGSEEEPTPDLMPTPNPEPQPQTLNIPTEGYESPNSYDGFELVWAVNTRRTAVFQQLGGIGFRRKSDRPTRISL